MMSVKETLLFCFNEGINISLRDDGNLSCIFPDSPPKEKHIKFLKKDKQKIIELFQELNIKNCYPVTETQAGIYAASQIFSDAVAYNMPLSIGIEGPLLIDKLKIALVRLIKENPILRSRYLMLDDLLFATTIDCSFDILNFEDMTGNSLHTVSEKIESIQKMKFNLDSGPLFCFHLLKISDNSFYLVLVFHHIVFDATSMQVFLKRLSQLYNDHSLYVVDNDFFQIMSYDSFKKRNPAYTSHFDYWKSKLQNHHSVARIPADFDRTYKTNNVANSIIIDLEREAIRNLKKFCMDNEVTLFMVLISIYALAIFLFSGSDEINIGVPISVRDEMNAKNTIGCFISVVVINLKIDTKLSFAEFLTEVYDECMLTFKHKHFSLYNLVDSMTENRAFNESLFFQCMFTLQNTEKFNLSLDGVVCRTISANNPDAKYDISLLVHEEPSKINMELIYASSIFEETKILDFCSFFKKTLDKVLNDKAVSVASCVSLSEEQANSLITYGYQSYSTPQHELCLHDLLQTQVLRNPDAVAIIFGTERLTYRLFNAKANAVALELKKHGVSRGSYVNVMMKSGFEVPIAYFAVMKMGAIFIPISYDFPGKRISKLLEISNSSLILTNKDVQCDLKGVTNIHLDYKKISDIYEDISNESDCRDSIYVIFTSGTTGEPKGAINHHKGIVNRLLSMNKYFGYDESDVILQTTFHVYDSVIWQYFWPLINGCKVVLLREEDKYDVSEVLNIIHQNKITFVDFTPSFFSTFAHYLLNDPNNFIKIKSLRHIILGGESLNISILKDFMTKFPNIEVTNAYGPTEASIGSVFHTINHDKVINMKEQVIGLPIDNTYAMVLDENRKPVKYGLKGDLYLAGDCVGYGYLNNLKATEQAFFVNPFPAVNSRFIYRTGDRVRQSGDGIVYLGRSDSQIKHNGFRVEIEEIEGILNKHPSIVSAAIIQKIQKTTESILVAYYIMKNKISSAEIRKYLLQYIPIPVIPNYFVAVDSLPIKSSGKIDKEALRSVPIKSEVCQAPPPAMSRYEKILSEIWVSVLGLDNVDISSTFFDLGGNSLGLIKVLKELRSSFDKLQISVIDLFKYPSIRTLASYLDCLDESNSEVE